LTLSTKIRQSFLAGLLALAPLYITLKILSILWGLVDKPLGERINLLIQQTTGTDVHIPGLGIVCTLLIVLGIGWLTRMVFFKRLLGLVDKLIDQVPIVRSLYNASRQIVVPFTDKNHLPFSEVVLCEYPMAGRYTLGMVAKRQLSSDPDDDRIVVFFPSNHLHLGYPVVVSKHDVQVLDMTIEEAIKFFVSCGVVGNEQLLKAQGELVTMGARDLGPLALRKTNVEALLANGAHQQPRAALVHRAARVVAVQGVDVEAPGLEHPLDLGREHEP
jgi:uncharacterized membrane protein